MIPKFSSLCFISLNIIVTAILFFIKNFYFCCFLPITYFKVWFCNWNTWQPNWSGFFVCLFVVFASSPPPPFKKNQLHLHIWTFPGPGVDLELSCGLWHSHRNTGSEPCLQPVSQVRVVPDPLLSQDRDRTHILTNSTGSLTPWATKGIPVSASFYFCLFVGSFLYLHM